MSGTFSMSCLYHPPLSQLSQPKPAGIQGLQVEIIDALLAAALGIATATDCAAPDTCLPICASLSSLCDLSLLSALDWCGAMEDGALVREDARCHASAASTGI